MSKSLLIVAHSGLDYHISKDECLDALKLSDDENINFIDFEIGKRKLSELYDLPFEQLALEQHRMFNELIEPLIKTSPDITIVYFGLAPIPLALHLGFLFGNFSKFRFFQYHHSNKYWFEKTEAPDGYNFQLKEVEKFTKVEKGIGDVFIRISTSYRIEPQHTYEIKPDPTNEFDIGLLNPHVDGITTHDEIADILNGFQDVLATINNYLPDRDKIHLFVSSTPAIAFGIGTRINPTVFPYLQTYQFSKDENPKYKEAILIRKESILGRTYKEQEKEEAQKLREQWAFLLAKEIKSFVKSSVGINDNWLVYVGQNNSEIDEGINSAWKFLPQLHETSLKDDTIDIQTSTISDGFTYDSINRQWQIDDGMFISLNERLSKVTDANLSQAGRLFLFHEGLHYCSKAHDLIAEIASGIGQFPKVIEDADYQADVYALLYEYKYNLQYDVTTVESNVKKFFLTAIDTATETMWSFIDDGVELNELPIRSINRFLNWYWQWVRIERLDSTGSLEEITAILFEQPVIELAGPPPFIVNRRRVALKLNAGNHFRYEIAIFHKNKIVRASPTGIDNIVEGLRELNGQKIKTGLRSILPLIRE